MKKLTKITTVVLIMTMTLCSLGIFAACKDSKITPTAVTLDLPGNLTIDEILKTITWDAVENSSGYSIQIDSADEIDVTNNTYSLANLENGEHKIKIKAIGDGLEYTDSDWSEIEYTAFDFKMTRMDTPQFFEGFSFRLDTNFTESKQFKLALLVSTSNGLMEDVVVQCIFEIDAGPRSYSLDAIWLQIEETKQRFIMFQCMGASVTSWREYLSEDFLSFARNGNAITYGTISSNEIDISALEQNEGLIGFQYIISRGLSPIYGASVLDKYLYLLDQCENPPIHSFEGKIETLLLGLRFTFID